MKPTRSSAADRRASFTQARLKELLHYDPVTGVFTRALNSRNNTALTGKEFGSISKGYLTGYLDDIFMRLNRLAWFYMTGKWPVGDVDHINTIKTDNCWGNLRDISRMANSQNRRRANVTNKLGFHGVTEQRNGRFQARIRVNGKLKSLGAYESPMKAHQVFVDAKRALHEGCTL